MSILQDPTQWPFSAVNLAVVLLFFAWIAYRKGQPSVAVGVGVAGCAATALAGLLLADQDAAFFSTFHMVRLAAYPLVTGAVMAGIVYFDRKRAAQQQAGWEKVE